MQRYKLVIAYDGTHFGGWQVQTKSSKPTIAGTLQKVFKELFDEPITILGVSRTDAGVHARGQVATFTTNLTIDANVMMNVWNNGLPPAIVICSCTAVPQSYNPFTDIKNKVYSYTFFTEHPLPFYQHYGWRYPFPEELDIKKLPLVLKAFEGTHDFRSFCTGDEMGDDTVRSIESIKLKKLKIPGAYRIEITGRRFMRHMIRRIVGAALQIASHVAMPIELVQTILSEKNPNQPFIKAPAKGLLLHSIIYSQES